MKPFQALKIESFFDEEKLKKIISRRIKAPQEKTKNVKFKAQPTFFKSGTSYPSNFREKIYQRKSSFSIEKATTQSEKHSTRTEEKEPKYFLPEEYRQENEFWNCGESEQDIFNRELKKYKAEHKGGRIPKFENCKWEAIINLNYTHTMADAQKVAEYIAKKFNFTTTRIAIHRDEGHFESDENGEKCVVYNYHAHLNFITLKDAKQNMRREHISAKDLSQAQDEIAEILKMERGERLKDLYGEHYHETKATKKHKSGRQYAQEQKALELTKEQIKAEWKKIYEESKGQGYSQEYFKALSNLRKDLLQEQSIKIHDLNEILERFKREQEKLKKENEALKKENERLKAELAKNRTETALETQNEPKARQEPNQELKSQETAPKAKSQEQIDLEIVQELDKKPIWEQGDTRTFYNILQRLKMTRELQILERKLNEPKISCPGDFTSSAINELNKLIAKEKAEKEQKDAELKRANELKKEMERQKAQGNFTCPAKSQSQGRTF